MKPLLAAQNVTRVFGGGLFGKRRTVAVDEVSLAINEEKPSITAIAGESGSGKTTLARLLLGVIRPTQGVISFRGRDLRTMERRERREFRREVQAIFQDPFEVYNPFYRIDQVLTTPVRKFRLAGTREEAQQRIEESLQLAGLRPEETLGRYPHQLSGGQRQRIILADEPVSMVDASLRATILESLMALKQELGISLVYITHDLTTAYQISENIYVMYRGSVAEMGSVEQVIRDPQHPYTRLLVSSIPLPDPDIRWGGEAAVERQTSAANATKDQAQGCKFASRCPLVMAECHAAPPPLYRTDASRAVACYLYKDSPAVSGGEMAEAIAA